MAELSYAVTSPVSDLSQARRGGALAREDARSGEVTQVAFYGGKLEHLYEVADGAFAAPTRLWLTPFGGGMLVSEGTPSASIADPEVLLATRDAPVLQALEQLRGWLNVSYEQLAQVAGVPPSLIYYWRRRHREGKPPRPRASTVERFWRVHSLLRALADTLEGEDRMAAVQLWIRHAPEGNRSPLDLLMDGRLVDVEARARPLLFDQTVRRPPVGHLALLEREEELEPVSGLPSTAAHEDTDFG
jgi:hypothetical protein